MKLKVKMIDLHLSENEKYSEEKILFEFTITKVTIPTVVFKIYEIMKILQLQQQVL